MKRIPGDIQVIEARQAEIVAVIGLPEVAIMLAVISSISLALTWISYDDPVRCNVEFLYRTWLTVFCQKRAAFTRNSIFQMYAKYPHFNWVICHSSYSIAFDGVDGTDYAHTHHELPISFGRTIGSVCLTYLQFFFLNLLNRYDLYWAKSGTFNRYGDGGFINVRTPSFKPVSQQYDFM